MKLKVVASFLFCSSFLFAQSIDLTKAYENLASKSTLVWACNTYTTVQMPSAFYDLPSKFQDYAIYDDHSQLFDVGNNYALNRMEINNKLMINGTDTVFMIDPLTKYQERIVVALPRLKDQFINSVLRLNEAWYFDNNSKSLKSEVATLACRYNLLSSNGTKMGETGVFYKWNQPGRGSQTLTSGVLTREISFKDETSKEIMQKFGKDINDWILENLPNFKLVDNEGYLVSYTSDLLNQGKADTIYQINPNTLEMEVIYTNGRLNSKDIISYEIEERWLVDEYNFTISKEVLSCTPIFKDADGNRKKLFKIIFG